MRAVLYVVCLVAVLSVPGHGAAQTPLRASEEQLVNYAYATQLGSGVYDVSGRTLQIYRLPFGYTLTQPSAERPGVRLMLPVTFGFLDFKTRDVIESGLPEHLDTLSFVPGIELDFELTPEWHLLPYAEAGRTWDRSGDGDARVYSLGAHVAMSRNRDWLDLRFDIDVTYAAVKPRAELPADDLAILQMGIEGRHALGLSVADHPLDWGAYLLGDTFLNRPDEPLNQATDSADRYQLEVGVTFGTRSRVTVWHIPLPRLGVGYRWSQGLEVWRFVIGAPF